MKKSTVIYLIIIALYLNACTEPLCEKGYGDLLTRNYSESDFTGISSDISANVYVHYSENFEVKAIAQENILNVLNIKVKNNTLKITYDKCVIGNNNVDIVIGVPNLSEIEIMGSGNAICEDSFTAENLKLKILGSGSIKFSDLEVSNELNTQILGSGSINITGTSIKTFTINILSSGNLNAFDIKAQDCNVLIEGSGNSYVNVQKNLDSEIYGSGSVFYIGNPIVTAQILGSGKVVNVN